MLISWADIDFCVDFRANKMSTAKKQKIDCEGRVFNSEWCTKYFVIPHNQGVICLVLQNSIAVIKEYNINCCYMTKHSFHFNKIVGQTQINKIEQMKKFFKKQQNIFTTYKNNSELVTKLSFKFC